MRTSLLPIAEIRRRSKWNRVYRCLRYLRIMSANSACLMILSSMRIIKREFKKRKPSSFYSRSSLRYGKAKPLKRKIENIQRLSLSHRTFRSFCWFEQRKSTGCSDYYCGGQTNGKCTSYKIRR